MYSPLVYQNGTDDAGADDYNSGTERQELFFYPTSPPLTPAGTTPPPAFDPAAPQSPFPSAAERGPEWAAAAAAEAAPSVAAVSAASPSIGATALPRFYSRKIACIACHVAKVSCDGGRPCARCLRLQQTAQCRDRPSKLSRARQTSPQAHSAADYDAAGDAKRSRDEQLQPPTGAASTSSPPLSPSSPSPPLPPPLSSSAASSAAVYPPYSEALVSHSTVRAHQRWLSAHDIRHGKLSLRDVFTHYGWLCEMATADGVLELFHSPKLARRDWMQQFALTAPPAQAADWTTAAGSDAPTVSVRPLVRSRLRRHQAPACDGSVCGHYCLFMHRLFLALPVIINWESSPLTASSASTGCELHPMLTVRRQRLTASDIAQQQSLIHSVAESVVSGGGRERRQGQPEGQPDCVELRHQVQVNAAFERLLGYSQAELRSLYASQGERVLYRLLRSDAWETVLVLEKEVKWEMRSEYRIYAVCLNKWQTELPCLLHGLVDYDDDGYQRETRVIFVPLPEQSSGPRC